ncbi:MAG: DUF721 domain-containing protein [Roseimicrobium sp.]
MRYASHNKLLRHRLLTEWRGVEDGPLNNSEAVGMSTLVPQILKGWRLDEQVRSEDLAAVWQEIVGEFIAKQTAPDGLKRGILSIRVLQPTVHHTLVMEKARLLAKLQARFGSAEVRDVRFRHG